jgi:hypothetical protein
LQRFRAAAAEPHLIHRAVAVRVARKFRLLSFGRRFSDPKL